MSSTPSARKKPETVSSADDEDWKQKANELLKKTWGKPLEEIIETMDVVRSPEGSRADIPIPEKIAVLQLDWHGLDVPLMIRREYLTALACANAVMNVPDADTIRTPSLREDQTPPTIQEIEAANPFKNYEPTGRGRPMIISGPPGIGKTMWLAFVLVLRLAAKLPTVYQFDSKFYFYFKPSMKSRGQVTMHFIEQERLSATSYINQYTNNCWWLMDSNLSVVNPHDQLLVSRIPLIQAASHGSRVDWGRKYVAQVYFMRTWSEVEIICARMLQRIARNVTEAKLMDLFKRYIPAARAIYYASDATLAYETSINDAAKKTNEQELQIFERIGGQTSEENFSHHIFALVPSLKGSRLDTPRLVIPTSYLRNKVERVLEMKSYIHAANCYRILASSPTLASVAGQFLEDRMHSVFPQGLIFNKRRLKRSRGQINDIWTLDPTSEPRAHRYRPRPPQEFTSKSFEGLKLQDDVYYRPISPNFPTLDAFFYRSATKRAVILQSTVSNEHSLHARGLKRLIKLKGVEGVDCIVWSTLSNDQLKVTAPKEFSKFIKKVTCIKVDLADFEHFPLPHDD